MGKEQQQQVLSASAVIGNRVKNPQGENLGRIQDVIIDPETGRIVGAVLAHENGPEGSSRLSAIPWNAITLSEADGSLYVDPDVVGHPLRRQEDWPDTRVPRFSRNVSIYTSTIYKGAGQAR